MEGASLVKTDPIGGRWNLAKLLWQGRRMDEAAEEESGRDELGDGQAVKHEPDRSEPGRDESKKGKRQREETGSEPGGASSSFPSSILQNSLSQARLCHPRPVLGAVWSMQEPALRASTCICDRKVYLG